MLQAEFDRGTGKLTFSDPEIGDTQIRAGVAWARYRMADGTLRHSAVTGLGATIDEQAEVDSLGSGAQWVCSCLPNQDKIALTYRIKTYEQRPFVLLRLELRNQGREPIRVDNLCLFQASPSNGGAVQISGAAENLRFFKVGWHGWSDSGLRGPRDEDRRSWLDGLTRLSYTNPATKRPKGRGEFSSEGWGILAGDHAAMVAGFATTAHQFGQVYTSLRSSHEALMLIAQLDDMRLDGGEMCESDWGYLQFVPFPNAKPEGDFVETVAVNMNARVPAIPPASMWTHWYQFFHEISEEIYLHNLGLLVENIGILPFQLAELDDGYQAAWGDWTSTNPKFSHGLQWLAREVEARGFTPGLWLAPFAVESKAKLARQHPDWLVKDDRGRPARVGFQYNKTTHALDLTNPQVLDHLRNVSRTLSNEFGFGMLKLDFINAAALPGRRYNLKLTRAEALRQGLEAIREGAGETTFLLGCGCPFGPAIGVVDAMRIGPDTAPSWKPYFHQIPWAGPLLRNNPSMPALRNASRNTLILSNIHKKWWWNDPDCLLVRNEDTRLSAAEVQSAVSLVGLSGGMLVDSDDLKKVAAERMQWLSCLMPNLGLTGEALDLLQHEMPRIFRAKIEHAMQEWQLVALFNWSDQPENCTLRFAELGYAPDEMLHVFDFWKHAYQHVKQAEMVFRQVPVHGCKVLRICRDGDKPVLVGDTLHISQGREVVSLRIAEQCLEVETIDLRRRLIGDLWIALDSTPKETLCNGAPVKVEQSDEGVYVLHLDQ